MFFLLSIHPTFFSQIQNLKFPFTQSYLKFYFTMLSFTIRGFYFKVVLHEISLILILSSPLYASFSFHLLLFLYLTLFSPSFTFILLQFLHTFHSVSSKGHHLPLPSMNNLSFVPLSFFLPWWRKQKCSPKRDYITLSNTVLLPIIQFCPYYDSVPTQQWELIVVDPVNQYQKL